MMETLIDHKIETAKRFIKHCEESAQPNNLQAWIERLNHLEFCKKNNHEYESWITLGRGELIDGDKLVCIWCNSDKVLHFKTDAG